MKTKNITSANHVVCHGIPSDKILKEGDIVNVDVTALKDGWHGDTSRTFEIGEISVKAKKLVRTTYDAMMKILQKGLNLREAIIIGIIIGRKEGYLQAESDMEEEIKDKLYQAFRGNRNQ